MQVINVLIPALIAGERTKLMNMPIFAKYLSLHNLLWFPQFILRMDKRLKFQSLHSQNS